MLKTFYPGKQHKKTIVCGTVFLASFAQWWALGLPDTETCSVLSLLWVIGLTLRYESEIKNTPLPLTMS